MAIDKVIRLEGASITWTNKQVAKMIEKETISFDNIVQRGEVWELWRMSELIWSILMNYPIPPIYCERATGSDDNKIKRFDCLDGKQRCTTIYKFLNDKFALAQLKPIPYVDENGNEQTVDVSGKRFSELDEELQDIIRDSTITVKYFDNLTQSKKAEMFRRLNQGKALSTKTKTLASAKNIGELLDIGSHRLFEEMLTERARQNKNQAVLVVKAWTILSKPVEEISFASKDFNPMIENVDITDREKLELNSVFDYIVNVHEELVENKEKDVAKKLYTETHLVSLIPYVSKAMENNINESMFAEFMVNFFKTENDSDVYTKYMEASNHGIARTANIVARHNALGESYKEFFKMEENSEKVS